MVCHRGISLSSGHYISYVRAPPTDVSIWNSDGSMFDSDGSSQTDVPNTEPEWFVCDDDVVIALRESDIKRKLSTNGATTPYMLFYRRMSA